MQSEDVKAFKNELRNYNYYLSRIRTLTNSIEWCYDRLGGVRGIDPSKEPTHAVPNKDIEYKLRDDIERLEHLKGLVQAKVDYIEQTLDRMETPLRLAVIEVFANHRTIRSIATGMYLSETGLRKRINKEIKKALIY